MTFKRSTIVMLCMSSKKMNTMIPSHIVHGEMSLLFRLSFFTSLTVANSVSYFKNVRISAIALIKMAMHARSGGDIEVMGLMQVCSDLLSLSINSYIILL